jgi:hypothetical protein
MIAKRFLSPARYRNSSESGLSRPSGLVSGAEIEENRVMLGQIQQPTAQILQFPGPSARARLDRKFQVNVNKVVAGAQVDFVVSGGSWYHELAIQEADRSRKP